MPGTRQRAIHHYRGLISPLLISTTKVRKAEFGNGWVQSRDCIWQSLDKARFTADRNPVTNIDAGIVGHRFFLATGGDTKNAGTLLNDTMDLPAAAEKPKPPAGLPGR